MSKQVILTHNAPSPGGTYSQGIRVGDEIFVAGSGPYDPVTHENVPGGIKEQTRRTLQNIIAIVEAGGGTAADIVKVTVFLKDMTQFKEMDSAYAEFFTVNPPVRTTVQAVLFGEGRLIVIDAIAHLG
jgi:2-iminobutanoate/2-iminopropanoate deaminase